MREFDYKQRPATQEYREGWDEAFPATPSAERPAMYGLESPATTVDGSRPPTLSPLDGDRGTKHPHTFTSQEGRIIAALWPKKFHPSDTSFTYARGCSTPFWGN